MPIKCDEHGFLVGKGNNPCLPQTLAQWESIGKDVRMIRLLLERLKRDGNRHKKTDTEKPSVRGGRQPAKVIPRLKQASTSTDTSILPRNYGRSDPIIRRLDALNTHQKLLNQTIKQVLRNTTIQRRKLAKPYQKNNSTTVDTPIPPRERRTTLEERQATRERIRLLAQQQRSTRVQRTSAISADTTSPRSRDARGRFTSDAHRASSPSATPNARRSNNPNSETNNTGRRRDSRGRFTSGDNEESGLKTAIESLSLHVAGLDPAGVDPAVDAVKEIAGPIKAVATPMIGAVSWLANRRGKERTIPWFKRLWREIGLLRRDENEWNRRHSRENAERGQGGNGSWLMLLLAGVGTLFSKFLNPMQWASMLGNMLAKIIPNALATRLMPLLARVLDRRNTGSSDADINAGDNQRNRQGGRGRSRLGRLAERAGSIKGLGLISTALGLTQLATTEMDSNLTREEKNVEHGGTIGRVAPAALGATIGGAIGSIIPGLGTAIGAVVGGYAADYFFGDAGETIGKEAADWVNKTDFSQLPSQMLSSVTGWVNDLKNSKIGQSISSTWAAFVTESKGFLNGTLKTLEEQGNQLNDWVKEKTGIDLKATASQALEGVNQVASAVGDLTVKTLDQGNTAVKDLTGFDAKANLETANKAIGDATTLLADSTKQLAKGAYDWASNLLGYSTPAPENKAPTTANNGGFSLLNMAAWGARNYGSVRSSMDAVTQKASSTVSSYVQSSPALSKIAQTVMGEKQKTVSGLIHWGESKQRGYNDYNRGSDRRAASNRQNLDLQNMTIGQIMQQQALPIGHKDRLFAVGKYEAIPDTLKDAVKTLGISKDSLFSSEIQEKIFTEYLATNKKGRGGLESYIKGTSDDLTEANLDVAKEWASVAHTGNSGYYDGVGNNKAHISSDEMRESLTNARAKYQQLISQGMDEKRAYGVALGSYQADGTLTPPPQAPLARRAISAVNGMFATDAHQEVNKDTLPAIVQRLRVKDSSGKTRTLSEMGVKSFDELQSKGGQAFEGGYNNPEALYATSLIQEGLGDHYDRTSAQNDAYHQKHSPNSAHTKGMKTDFTVKGISYAEANRRTEAILAEKGLVKGVDFNTIDEGNNPSQKATGAHIDFKLLEAGRAKIQQIMQAGRLAQSTTPKAYAQLPVQKASTIPPIPTAPSVTVDAPVPPSSSSSSSSTANIQLPPSSEKVGRDVSDRIIAHIVAPVARG